MRLAIALTGVATAAVLAYVDSDHFRVSAGEAVVVVLAALALGPLSMLIVVVVVAGIGIGAYIAHTTPTQITFSGAILLVAVSTAGMVQVSRRHSLGLRGRSPESVIVSIRSRLKIQGALPPLPDDWHIDIEQRAADGAAMAGDFVASRVVEESAGPVLHLAVVDVSGKGIEAGTRALLLSGAVGGLLGAVPAEGFLAEANSYLLRQRWRSGFATCIYLRLELASGRFELRSAGHPAPVQRGADGWQQSTTRGVVLGVIDEHLTSVDAGVLQAGDALVLFTDGVVEDRRDDLDVGIERLTVEIDRLLLVRPADDACRYRGIAGTVVETVPTERSDDRAVVLISRGEAPSLSGSVDRRADSVLAD